MPGHTWTLPGFLVTLGSCTHREIMSTENIVPNKSDTCLQVAFRQGKTSGITVSKPQGFVCCTTTIILTKPTSYTPQGKQEAQTLLESNKQRQLSHTAHGMWLWKGHGKLREFRISKIRDFLSHMLSTAVTVSISLVIKCSLLTTAGGLIKNCWTVLN